MGCSESAPDANGHITLDAKQAGKRSAGNPHAAFDEAGAGNVTSGAGFTGPYRRRASPRPYLKGAEWINRRIKISSLLINADLTDDLRDILDTHVLPFQSKNDVAIDAPCIVGGQVAYNQSGEKILVPTTQRHIETIWKDIRKRYLIIVPGFGSLIHRHRLSSFRRETGAFEVLLREWVCKFRTRMENDKQRIVSNVVSAIGKRVELSNRDNIPKDICLNDEVRKGFESMRVIEPRVRIVTKNVSWEASRDSEFTDALQRVLPPDDLRGWFDEFTAVEGKR